MAIINTLYSFGWYGTVENDQPFSLRDNIGTFVWDTNQPTKRRYEGPYASQLAGRDFSQRDFGILSALYVWGYHDGGGFSWNIGNEFDGFHLQDYSWTNPDGSAGSITAGDPNRPGGAWFDTLQPGCMYWIYCDSQIPNFNIPGFIPSANGVDMGRVVPA